MTGTVLETVDDVRSLSLDDLGRRPRHETLVMVDPAYYDREYVINPHMGGEVDAERARAQWDRLYEVYDDRVEDLRVLDPVETWTGLPDGSDAPAPAALPDMVFVANHAVPTADGEGVVLARMATDERAGEPAHFRTWAEAAGYDVHAAPDVDFEGTGDALWHPGRRLLWGGYGVRTDRAVYDRLSDRLDATVVPLELTDEHYYHLDVSLAPLSESTALIQPAAFTDAGVRTVEAAFDRVLRASPEEPFAVNVEAVGDTVVMGAGAPETAATLEDAGYEVVTVETGEFLKAGGSVCCLTLSLGAPS